jgi:uncharacterized protein (DUF433 family)
VPTSVHSASHSCSLHNQEIQVNWRERISVDPALCHGQACIRGTRIPVAVVLDNLARGSTADELIRSYPTLSHDDIAASLEYAAELARERTVPLPSGAR